MANLNKKISFSESSSTRSAHKNSLNGALLKMFPSLMRASSLVNKSSNANECMTHLMPPKTTYQSAICIQKIQDENYFMKTLKSQEISQMTNLLSMATLTNESTLDSIICSEFILEDKAFIAGIQIRAAKLSKLLQILIESFHVQPNYNNNEFPRVFFLMHKWFIESQQLANHLTSLYDAHAVTSETQLGICYATQYWINTYPLHFALDSSLVEAIRCFTNLIKSKGNKEHLQLVDISNIGSYEWMRKMTTRNPIKYKQNVPLSFNKLEPEILAAQLTYLEWKTLRRITFIDYKNYVFKGSMNGILALERSIQTFNGLSQWIQCMILSRTTPKQRAEIIHKFIEVAKHLKILKNFNTLMAVVGGIAHSAISRLSKTNLHLSLEDHKTLNDFMELLSSNYNYAQYRKATNECSKDFWIPIIGIHLKDMISIHTALADKLDDELINFRKMAQLSIIFQNLNNLQNSLPPVQENRDLIKLLQLSLDLNYTEDEIYELSLAREPRTSVSSPNVQTKFTEFAEWARNVTTPPDPHTIHRHVNAMIEAVFKNYDHDRDGYISHAEFEEITQNYPFIDSFAVLDADKDGVISKQEMRSYFLRANYHALKSEFKHDFHEVTYFKLTYCTHCDGLLWGLIKQGWKCKDCGINAHKDCRHRVVMECRAKPQQYRNASSISNSIQRQISDSTQSGRPKRQPRKQKSTQTEYAVSLNTTNHDDLFLSDDSLTSNEDASLNDYTHGSGSLHRLHPGNGSFDINKSNDHIDHSPSNSSSHNDRHKYKKLSKRRKSLPLQGDGTGGGGGVGNSSNEDIHQVPLIPRGPLICSNSEQFGNWLPPQQQQHQQQQQTYDKQEQTSISTFDSSSKVNNTSSSVKQQSSINNESEKDIEPVLKERSNAKKKGCKLYRIVDSDYFLNEYIDDYSLDDEIMDTTFSSYDEEDESMVFKKLKELENEKDLLVLENLRMKKKLDAAVAQIDELKQEISSIRCDAVDYLIKKMDNMHVNSLVKSSNI